MRKVEIFTVDSGMDAVLQKQINSWFERHPRVIVERVLQSESWSQMSGFHLAISIFYDEVDDE